MTPSLQASREGTGGREIGVSERVFELKLDLGVRIPIREPLPGRLRRRLRARDLRGLALNPSLEAEFVVVDEKLVGLESEARRKRSGEERKKSYGGQ